MAKSVVAGIVGITGDLRMVITERWRIHHHVSAGEKLFVLPGILVDEPVPWDDLPGLVYSTWRYVLMELSPDSLCGDCHACCLRNEDLVAPFKQACGRCTALGCTIHWRRPQTCRDFECVWLQSQQLNDKMPDELRPDRCGAYLTRGDDPLVLKVHPVDDIAPALTDYLTEMQAAGWVVHEADP